MADQKVDRRTLFTPQSLAVEPMVRRLLQRLITVERHTLEYTGEDFGGFVTFRIPTLGTLSTEFDPADILTVCAELAQGDLGIAADVSQWLVDRPADDLVSLQPREYELQEEDRGAVRSNPFFNEHAGDVRPVNGWNS